MIDDLKDYIRTVPDYPIEGVNFYDMNSLFAGPIFHKVVREMADHILEYKRVTHIAGLESRGFVLGAAVAHELKLPFVMIRKEGAKYPGELLKESYDLEYGSATLTLQTGLLGHVDRVAIVDDLVATGGSMAAAIKLVRATGAKVVCGSTAVDLKYLREGPITIEDVHISSIYGEWETYE